MKIIRIIYDLDRFIIVESIYIIKDVNVQRR